MTGSISMSDIVITRFVVNGTITMKTLKHLLNLGKSLAVCGKYGNYKIEIVETQRVEIAWLQQQTL